MKRLPLGGQIPSGGVAAALAPVFRFDADSASAEARETAEHAAAEELGGNLVDIREAARRLRYGAR